MQETPSYSEVDIVNASNPFVHSEVGIIYLASVDLF